MKRYAVKTRFMFEGCFFISAKDKAQAKEYAEKNCGLVMGRGVHSTLPDDANVSRPTGRLNFSEKQRI